MSRHCCTTGCLPDLCYLCSRKTSTIVLLFCGKVINLLESWSHPDLQVDSCEALVMIVHPLCIFYVFFIIL